MTKLKVRSPADLIAAVPFLIGFHPADSLVVAAVKGAMLAFAARIDLPQPGVPDCEARAPILHLAGRIAEQQPEAIALIGYGASDRVTPSLLRLSDALKKAGVRILDEFRVADGRYWSYLCADKTCCPEEGRPCAPPDSVLAAEATFAGAVALPSRADLEAQLAPLTGAARTAMDAAEEQALTRLHALIEPERPAPERPAQESAALEPAALESAALEPAALESAALEPAALESAALEPAALESAALESAAPAAADLRRSERLVLRAGRTAVRTAERRYRSGGRLTDAELAWLGYLLTFLPVRDFAWIRSGTDDWEIALWSDVVRRINPERVPAPASLLAFIAWRSGQGALAVIAVERALDADRNYSLAQTMNSTLFQAVSPTVLAGWPTPTGQPAPPEPSRPSAWPPESQRI